MKRCYLFDENGTLRNDLTAVYRSMCDVFVEFGRMPPRLDEYRNQRAPDFWPFYAERGFAESERPLVVKRFSEIFHSRYEWLVKPFADALPTISALKEQGSVIGVVSNYRAGMVRTHLKEYGIAEFVSVVVGREDADEQKPSPKPLFVAFNRLGIQPGEGCYTGDSGWDVQAAHAAGTTAIAVSRRGSHHSKRALLVARPDRLISRLDELLTNQ